MLLVTLMALSCGKDKTTAPEPQRLVFSDYDGPDAIIDLGDGPLDAIIEGNLTNIDTSFYNENYRDHYTITLSTNGDILLFVQNHQFLAAPVNVSVVDPYGGFSWYSTFGIDRNNEPIEVSYYGQRTLLISVEIHSTYRAPDGPEIYFKYELRIIVP
jgi:hypothetical protein